jgi:hypothetical protein
MDVNFAEMRTLTPCWMYRYVDCPRRPEDVTDFVRLSFSIGCGLCNDRDDAIAYSGR